MQTLVVGIGSPHGDDQAGWLVAVKLAARQTAITVRRAQVPVDLLDWLDGVERLIVCDACEPAGQPGSIRHWIWPAELTPLRAVSSHGLDIASVLSLAETLGKLPSQVHVWGIEAAHCEPGDEVSPVVMCAVERIATAIHEEGASKSQSGD
jgi:hydrogenase maturation protease